MTIAISEILKQVELLSAIEQEELAHKLMERTRQRRASQYHNDLTPAETSPISLPTPEVATSQDGSGGRSH